MKMTCLLTVLRIAAVVFSLPAFAIDDGQGAPEFELPARQGTLKLSDFKGKTVYLDFWASWCSPCRQSFPWLNEMQARYGGKGLRVVGLNVDQNTGDARTFLKEHPANFDVVFDDAGKVPRAYAIKGMPTSVLIGPDGKVIAVHSGFRNDTRSERERQIKLSLRMKDE